MVGASLQRWQSVENPEPAHASGARAQRRTSTATFAAPRRPHLTLSTLPQRPLARSSCVPSPSPPTLRTATPCHARCAHHHTAAPRAFSRSGARAHRRRRVYRKVVRSTRRSATTARLTVVSSSESGGISLIRRRGFSTPPSCWTTLCEAAAHCAAPPPTALPHCPTPAAPPPHARCAAPPPHARCAAPPPQTRCAAPQPHTCPQRPLPTPTPRARPLQSPSPQARCRNGSRTYARSQCSRRPALPCGVQYLNLLDWSSDNLLGVALGESVYLWRATDGAISQLLQLTEGSAHVTSIAFMPGGGYSACRRAAAPYDARVRAVMRLPPRPIRTAHRRCALHRPLALALACARSRSVAFSHARVFMHGDTSGRRHL